MNSKRLKGHAISCLLLVLLLPACVQNNMLVVYSRPTDGYWQVWASKPDGSQPRQITKSAWDKRSLRAMKNSSSVMFRNNQGELFAMAMTGTNRVARIIADMDVVKDADFDPVNGFLVATYAANAVDNIRIWQVSENEQKKQLLVPDVYLNDAPRWIPGSKRYVFVKTHEGRSAMFHGEVGTQTSARFFKNEWMSQVDPAPAPDGGLVAFCRESGAGMDLWLANSDGSRAHPLYKGKGMEAEPAWTPDGTWIYFSTWDDGNFRIARIHADGSDFEFVTATGVNSRNPACMVVAH